MPQQINLCTPILLTQRRYFSAQTMVQALACFVVVGGALSAWWVWSLKSSSEAFRETINSHAAELGALQTAIAAGRVGGAPVDAGLVQQLQVRRGDVEQRERLLAELRSGLFREGWGQSARLQLVAQSIPPQVWVTAMKANDTQLEVGGFTLEPAALNDWVRRLAASPLLQGQALATVKVERAGGENTAPVPDAALVATGAAAAAAGTAPRRPTWSFVLTSAVSRADAAPAKGKP